MRVVKSGDVRCMDALAAEKFNIPGIILMENAAMACTRELLGFESAVILCGRGNNAGDGFAIARQLLSLGKKVKIFLALGSQFSGDALINYNILKSMGADISEDFDGFEAALKNSDAAVDALFGTGFKGKVVSPLKEYIETLNQFSKYTLSVDVPSGINADTGEVETVCVNADKTVTFAAVKPGLLLFPGADFSGETVCDNISMPQALLDRFPGMKTLEAEYIESIMPKRCQNSQKGDYGKIFIIGGAKGMAGAVSMAADAAFLSGAGIVTACVPCEINDIIQKTCKNAMTYPADFAKDTNKIIEKMQGYDVVLFGCGIGREDCVLPLLEAVIKNAKKLVIDADGLFALSKNCGLLKECRGEVILTPHAMEMARLIGKDAAFVEKNRLLVSAEFVSEYKQTLVLKGNHSIITAALGSQSINMTGNSGMATAGSGDVLAGMCAAFLATCENSYNAAELSVYLHGAAGDRAAARLSEYSLTAPDIAAAIPHILPVAKKA